MDYHKEYLEYKRKYIDLRDAMLYDLQDGGNIFSDFLSKSKRRKIEATKPVLTKDMPKPVVAWFHHLGDWINYDKMMIDRGIYNNFMDSRPITYDEYIALKTGELATLSPAQADTYMGVNKDKLDPVQKAKFTFDYIRYAINKGSDLYVKKQEEYFVPVRYLILRFEQVADQKQKNALLKFLKEQADKNNNYKEWVAIIERSVEKTRPRSLQPVSAQKWVSPLPKQVSEPGQLDVLPELKQPIRRPLPSIPPKSRSPSPPPRKIDIPLRPRSIKTDRDVIPLIGEKPVPPPRPPGLTVTTTSSPTSPQLKPPSYQAPTPPTSRAIRPIA